MLRLPLGVQVKEHIFILKEIKTLLKLLLRLILAIALAWLWIALCATPAYA
ncbi:MAG: hypothetical protein AB1589_11140 [Cyanobacteriota bacterium]